MLLYRYAKMMEEQNASGLVRDPGEGEFSELKEMKSRLEEVQLGLLEEDCSDWAVEATY